MKLTVIYSNAGDEDSKHLVHAWEGIKDAKVIELNSDVLQNDTEWTKRVDNAIIAEDDTILFIGHGTPLGLFRPDFGGYIIHKDNVSLVHAKRVICIWCYASKFCQKEGLHSLSSSMFISNTIEAIYNKINATQEHINNASIRFYKQICRLIESSVPMAEWKGLIDAETDWNDEVDVFNREGVKYID